MLEIAIWGICLMLLVKAFDVMHRQSVAKAAGTPGSAALVVVVAIIALGGAALLFVVAHEQALSSRNSLPSTPTMFP
jgi:hypothetical protein